jgi:AraC-like DNA-binding protein
MMARMERAPDLDAFVAAPVGRYVAGSNWLYFYPSTHVSGFVLWGTLDAASLGPTTGITPRVHAGARRPHVSLMDGRRVEKVDPSAFELAARYVKEHRAAIGDVITQLAVVYPDGLLGTIAAGFFQIIAPPYPVRVFSNTSSACEWLGIAETNLAGELDDLFAEVSGQPALVRDVRAHLESRGLDAGLDDVAAQLGTSPRTLQRRLAEHGTSFQTEVAAVRVRAAQRLLVDTDATVTEIAFAVGCASLHHFGGLFKKATGETPTRWREQRRASADAVNRKSRGP